MSGGLAWSQVRLWRSAPLEEAGQRLKATLDGLLSVDDELTAMGRTPSWSGEAAGRARAAHAAIYDQLEDVVTEVSAARRAMFEASDAVRGIEQAVRTVEDYAAATSLQISDTEVRDTSLGQCFAEPRDAEVAQAERQRVIDECVARIEQVLRRAGEVNAGLAQAMALIEKSVLARLEAGSLTEAVSDGEGLGGASSVRPPEGATPAQNAGWWDSLSPNEKEDIVAHHPELIANRDGVDFAARDRANRALLPKYQADVQARMDAIEAERAGLNTRDYDYYRQDAKLDEEYRQLQDKQASLTTLERIMKLPDRHLLGLDLAHPRAQAVISVGDVSTADHVAVFTPGLTSNVQGIDGYDQKMYDLRDRTQRTLKFHESQDSVATVTWLGYQAPQVSTTFEHDSVASSNSAREGGRDLAEFYRGVDASRTAAGGTAPDLTALGHSYGSTTTGYALRENTGADRAGFFGSPGLSVERADQLHVPAGAAYYEEALADPIADLSRFGTDPSSMAGMNHLWTGTATGVDGSQLDRVYSHTSYLQDESTSQYNLAALVAGHPEDVIRNPEPDPFLHQ